MIVSSMCYCSGVHDVQLPLFQSSLAGMHMVGVVGVADEVGMVDLVSVVGDASDGCSGNFLSSFSARQMSLHLCT